MAIQTVQPFVFTNSTIPVDEARIYTSYRQNVTAATAFITSQKTSSGGYVLVRASSIDDNTLFLNDLIAKHSEIRDQISYLLFAIRGAIPNYTSSTSVKARYQHGLSCIPKYAASHSCLTPHLIDNMYFSIIQKITADLSQMGKISDETKQEIQLLFYEATDNKDLPLLIQKLEETGSTINWQEQVAQRKAQGDQFPILQTSFSESITALKEQCQKETHPLLLKIGQINVALQKIGKPAYPEIQDQATASETIKNIDQTLALIDSILEEGNIPFSTDFLETTKKSLQTLRSEIVSSIFYRLETLLEPHQRESIISINSLMYQNMNITTEFPQYVNTIVDLAIEMEFRDYSIFLHNQISHGKISSKDAFTSYCERKNKFIQGIIQTFENQTNAMDQVYPTIIKIRSLAETMSSTDTSDVMAIFTLYSQIQEEWKVIKNLKSLYGPSENRAFSTINTAIKDLVDPNNYLQDSFERTGTFSFCILRNARLSIIEDTQIRQTLENIISSLKSQNSNIKEAFDKLLSSYHTDEHKISSLPIPVIKQFLFDFSDYFSDRFHQKRYYESIKDDEKAVRQFISTLHKFPSVNNFFLEFHMSSDSIPFFHHSILAVKLGNMKKDFSAYSFEQLKEFVNSYFLNIYDPAFPKAKDTFKEILTNIRKIKKDQETRVEFEGMRNRFAFFYSQFVPNSTSLFERLMQEAQIPSFLTAPKDKMVGFIEKFSHHLKAHPEHVIFIRDTIPAVFYQSLIKLASTSFKESAWQEVKTLVDKCKEAAEVQLKGSLTESDIPALEGHFFNDPTRSREQIIHDISLKPTHLYLKPDNAELSVAINPHLVEFRVEAKFSFSPDTRKYTVIDTDPRGYADHPSLHEVLQRHIRSDAFADPLQNLVLDI